MLRTTSIREDFAAIVGPGNLRAGDPADAICGIVPQLVVEPASEEELARALACANSAALTVMPRGGGTKMDWGNPPKTADVVMSTARLNRVLEHAWADLTATVEAGCTLASLQSALSRHGQQLAFDGLWPGRATVGGALSTNDSGALRLRYGSLRDLVIGATIALADGTLASSGGKVVKNVAGYDLQKLVTGALGTLGIITRATFRLHPRPQSTKTLAFGATSTEEMQRLILAIQDSKLAHCALQILVAAGSEPRAEVLFEGTDAGLDAQESSLCNILGNTRLEPSSELAWDAREQLADSLPDNAALLKFTFLPTDWSNVVHLLRAVESAENIFWRGVFQAIGIGFLRMNGEHPALRRGIGRLRSELERCGGSLVILRRPTELASLDAWGDPSDALPLMRAVKSRLDPKSTLNPGRFVGGI